MANRLYRVIAVILLAAVLTLAGCAQAMKPEKLNEAGRPKDTIFQVSTINALLQGLYDGEMTCGELKKQGDLGVGTFDGAATCWNAACGRGQCRWILSGDFT